MKIFTNRSTFEGKNVSRSAFASGNTYKRGLVGWNGSRNVFTSMKIGKWSRE